MDRREKGNAREKFSDYADKALRLELEDKVNKQQRCNFHVVLAAVSLENPFTPPVLQVNDSSGQVSGGKQAETASGGFAAGFHGRQPYGWEGSSSEVVGDSNCWWAAASRVATSFSIAQVVSIGQTPLRRQAASHRVFASFPLVARCKIIFIILQKPAQHWAGEIWTGQATQAATQRSCYCHPLYNWRRLHGRFEGSEQPSSCRGLPDPNHYWGHNLACTSVHIEPLVLEHRLVHQ